MRIVRMLIATIALLLPTLVVPSLMGAAQVANCEAAITGPGIYRVEESFSYPTCGAAGTVIRSGISSSFGLLHIEKRANETNNHEFSDFAMDQWQAALNEPRTLEISPGYYLHDTVYFTPGAGEQRTMCVYVDTKPYEGQGQKGVITAFWVPAFVACPRNAD